MEIRVAKTAGFCFGVKRAVDLTYGLLNEGCKVATLGPLIHNPQAVEDMQKKGALVADAIADVPAGYEVVIRSHGVPRTVYDELDARGITYHDATCPFVQKIQCIAAEAEKEGAVLLVAVELDEIMSLSDRIAVMFDGRIMGERLPGATDERELGLLMAGVGGKAPERAA